MSDSKKENISLKGKKIILYGAASIGILSKGYFERNGYFIEGFIDQRSNEIDEFLGKPVWDIASKTLDEMKSDEYIVYVAVKNVFEHSNIANALYSHGFRNIIYRPLASINGSGSSRQDELYRIYDCVEKEEFDKIADVPKMLHIDRTKAKNTGILEENETSVVCLVSMDMLHTDKKIRKTPWFDKPVMAELPHIDFFRYIAGEAGYTSERYMKFCIDSASTTNQIKLTEGWKRNVIRNRASVYAHMAEAMELNNSFFQKNAAHAIWDRGNGVFNLNSGKHRAAFFASKKRKYIPLRISREDYYDYLNVKVVEELESLYEKRGVTEINYPIPHPYYYNYPCENKEFWYGFLYWLMYDLAKSLYENYGQLDFQRICFKSELHDGGFIERALLKSGCRGLVAVFEAESEELKVLDKLLYSNVLANTGGKQQSEANGFDIALLRPAEESDYIRIKKLMSDAKNTKCYVVEEKDLAGLMKCEKENLNIEKVFSSVLNGKLTNVYKIVNNEQ